ncbi:MAG: hypothetical protein RR585_10610 [Coprobacillus sp.]
MSRLKVRIMWFALMVGICCLPVIVFIIQDTLVMEKSVQWSQQDNEYEIARNHPIISSLYSQYYSTYQSAQSPEYNIKNDLNQGKHKDIITKLQGYFNEEINQLLEYNVIPYELIELKYNEKFKADFGYIHDFSQELNRTLYLTQYYRLHTDNDVNTSYEYDQFSKKIKSLSIENKAINKLTTQELQTLCWNMVSYLELDDIDDWKYTSGAYESKKAKLIVYCYTQTYETPDMLNIGVQLRDGGSIYRYENLFETN